MDHTSTGAAPVKTGKADRRADLPFLVITLTLLGVGVVMVLSASFASAYYDLQGETGHNPVYFFSRQAIFAAAGVCVMLIASRIPMRVYRACALPLLLVSVASLAAVLVIGTVVNGARRWISLGFTTFQLCLCNRQLLAGFINLRFQFRKLGFQFAELLQRLFA